jgi:hypothetical protein
MQHTTDRWVQLADRLARRDKPIPIYHRIMVWAWRWAIQRSLRG